MFKQMFHLLDSIYGILITTMMASNITVFVGTRHASSAYSPSQIIRCMRWRVDRPNKFVFRRDKACLVRWDQPTFYNYDLALKHSFYGNCSSDMCECRAAAATSSVPAAFSPTRRRSSYFPPFSSPQNSQFGGASRASRPPTRRQLGEFLAHSALEPANPAITCISCIVFCI